MAQAAGFPTVFLTAYYALFELAHPRPGQTLLVHSAAGGVGSALLQLGRIVGCRTVGVVGSSHKVETARALGAEVVIDKSREDLWRAAEKAAPRGYDVVLDANGVATLRENYRHLAKPGKLVIYGFHSMLPRQGRRPNWVKLASDFLRTPWFDPLKLSLKQGRSRGLRRRAPPLPRRWRSRVGTLGSTPPAPWLLLLESCLPACVPASIALRGAPGAGELAAMGLL